MADSLICGDTQCRVSSVLNRDVKQFGKKFMFDSNEETCWNSDQGDCQWLILDFPQSVRLSEFKVQFQGGFSAKTCRLEGSSVDRDFTVISHFYPEDNNSLQCFPIQESATVNRIKITFEHSTDFFGRIIVYILDILGEKST
ncbi:nuclear receptor 2C2-associated protein isoform X1 [Syngnathus acus]|uniref:nuclear receptor 2C2-associated protein isoform X1 n=1 Tax=Syngnathus acus TaxID=161584 RepID=UPI001885F0DB|nr:nuclear receptor 2C2-associated protein isoform X1 [Syngnathus acus]